MSDSAKEGLSHESTPEEGGAPGESNWRGHHAIEYYDPDEECYRWWYAAENPTREGFCYSYTLVYLLEAERDTICSGKYEFDCEVVSLQDEVKKLLGRVEQL